MTNFHLVEDFIASVFEQLESGHSELTFGTSKSVSEGHCLARGPVPGSGDEARV